MLSWQEYLYESGPQVPLWTPSLTVASTSEGNVAGVALPGSIAAVKSREAAHLWRLSMTQMHQQTTSAYSNGAHGLGSGYSLDANIIIANAPDPVFVSDLEGKILQANDAASELLGFRPDELVEQSLSRFISAEEKREFTAALRDPDGSVIGAIGILRDMREYLKVLRDLEESKAELQEKILDLEKFEEVVVGRELKMIALEKEADRLRLEAEHLRAEVGRA